MIKLLKPDRKSLILEQINIHSRVTFNDLANLLNVSEDTIRRDVNELEQEHLVVRIKGGAMAKGNEMFVEDNNNFALEGKRIIAQKAAQFLKEGMIVILGGGTTIREVIKQIPENIRATILTLNPFTCIQLLAKSNIETILIGGRVSKYSQSVVGADAFLKLSEIKADLCIVSTSAIDTENGLTDSDWEAVAIKKAIFKVSKKIMVLAIAEKLNRSMNLTITHLNKVDYLITDLPPQHHSLEKYQNKGLNII